MPAFFSPPRRTLVLVALASVASLAAVGCAEPLQLGSGLTVMPNSGERLAMLCRFTSATDADVCFGVRTDPGGDVPSPGVPRGIVTDLPLAPQPSSGGEGAPPPADDSSQPPLPSDESGG